jgi:hypothetical protein
MSTGFVLLCVALGAGAIALWVHVRIGSGPLAPQNLRTALLHVGASLVVGQLAVPLLMKLLVGGSPLLNVVAIFLIAFPALIYCLLASIWMITMLQGSLRHR